MADAQNFTEGAGFKKLKATHDNAQGIADSCRLLMQAIEAAPEIDHAICVSFGIPEAKPVTPAK